MPYVHETKDCCGAFINTQCMWYCDRGASTTEVSESMKRDPERWIESYTDRNTQSVRARVLAANNGRR